MKKSVGNEQINSTLSDLPLPPFSTNLRSFRDIIYAFQPCQIQCRHGFVGIAHQSSFVGLVVEWPFLTVERPEGRPLSKNSNFTCKIQLNPENLYEDFP